MKTLCSRDTAFGLMTVIGATLIHLTFGFFYTVGNFNPYLVSYMKITTSQSIWFNSVILAGQSIGMPIGAILCKKVGFRVVTIISMFLTSGGLFLSRLTINYGLGPLICTYSIMFGLGMGLPYSVLYAVASAWFPNNRSAVIGIIAAGLGSGALFFIPLQSAFVNPNNLKNFEEPSIQEAIPNVLLILGGLILSIQLIGFALLREKPTKDTNEDFEKTIDQISVNKMPNPSMSVKNEDENSLENQPTFVKNYTTLEAAKTVDFYLLCTMTVLNVVSITLVSSTFKLYGKESGFDDKFLSIVATVSAVFNCLGRTIWGFVADSLSFKCPMGWLEIQWALLLACFPFVTMIPDTTAAKGLYAFCVFMLFACIAGHFVLLPSAATRIFGPKYMSTTFAFIFLVTAPSTLVLSAIISNFNIDGQWKTVYLSAAGACLLSFCCSIFLKDTTGTCIGGTQLCTRLCDGCRPEPMEDAANEATSDFFDYDDMTSIVF